MPTIEFTQIGLPNQIEKIDYDGHAFTVPLFRLYLFAVYNLLYFTRNCVSVKISTM